MLMELGRYLITSLKHVIGSYRNNETGGGLMSKKPQHISFGGLVSINGYDGHLYFVDAFTIEHINTPDEKWSEIWHDLTDAHNGEYTMAEAEDVTRICGADQADDYLRNSVKPVDISEIIFGGVPKMYSSNRKEPR